MDFQIEKITKNSNSQEVDDLLKYFNKDNQKNKCKKRCGYCSKCKTVQANKIKTLIDYGSDTLVRHFITAILNNKLSPSLYRLKKNLKLKI